MIKAKSASTLNSKAQPFLPIRLHRRSRSAEAILPEQVWASPPLALNYNNSEGGKKKTNQKQRAPTNKQEQNSMLSNMAPIKKTKVRILQFQVYCLTLWQNGVRQPNLQP